jgi:hypothetical protein
MDSATIIIHRADFASTQICVESIKHTFRIPYGYGIRESLLLEQAQQRDQCRT